MNPSYVYRADVLDVHDGDTYKLRVDLGFRCAVTIQCRLHGVDSPELNTPEGKIARDFVLTLINGYSQTPVVVQSYKDQRSFERWVCDVWLDDHGLDGRSLADVLVQAGHAVRI
jgi:micrococcal nuclease